MGWEKKALDIQIAVGVVIHGEILGVPEDPLKVSLCREHNPLEPGKIRRPVHLDNIGKNNERKSSKCSYLNDGCLVGESVTGQGFLI